MITLEPQEVINLKCWRKEHQKTCPFLNSEEGKVERVEAILDGKVIEEISYASGGGIGTRVLAKCKCGQEGDITDYFSW